jgi:hypothetical protein
MAVNYTFKATELFDYKKLKIIIDNWNEMPEDMKDGSCHIGDANLKMLVNTYYMRARKDEDIAEIPVSYKFSQMKGDDGRQYAVKQLSLQSLTRKIRHTITENIYNDIDMKNAHHSILVQYCKKKGWDCPELEKSVKNNELYLKDIMEADNVTRGDAKRVKLAVSYGSTSATSKAPWFRAFSEELKEIHKKMMEDQDNKGLIDKIKNYKKYVNIGTKGMKPWAVNTINKEFNTMGKLCGHLMCEIENKILVACIAHLKNERIPIKNVVLCFDGFMIPKKTFEPTEENLEKMSKYAEKKTGYKMKFVNKPQDEIINLEGLSEKKPTYVKVSNDKEACDKLLDEMKGSIFSCNSNIYVRTKQGNIWTSEETVVDREIVNAIMNMDIVLVSGTGKMSAYSKDMRGIKTLLTLIKYTAPIQKNLIETIRQKSKGKLFFKNGVYDFSMKKFRKETEQDMTPIRINRDYSETENEKVKKELMTIINSIFSDEQLAINMLQHAARGVAGCIEDKDFVFGVGLRDCGKGILTQLMTQSFGDYATEVNANNFIGSKRMGVTDEAKNRMWLLPHMWSRLLIANECDIDNGNERAIINGVLIKSLMSGGDVQKARALYKSEVDFVFNGRLIMFMNELPEIKPIDTCQHMALFEFPNKFIMPGEYGEKRKKGELLPYEKKADPDLKEKLKGSEYMEAFMKIVIENYRNEPVNNADTVKEASKNFRIDSGDELMAFKETFDYSDRKVFTSTSDLMEAISKVLPGMTEKKLKTYLTVNMKLTSTRKTLDGVKYSGYFGVKVKLQI